MAGGRSTTATVAQSSLRAELPSSPAASFNLIVINQASAIPLLAPPFAPHSCLYPGLDTSSLSYSAFSRLFPFFRPLRFRHACHHGGDSLPRHEDRHCCSSSPPLRRRSLWAYRQGDPEACCRCPPRREFGPDSSGIKQFCRCVVFTHTYSSRLPVADESHQIQQSHSRKMKRILLFGS